MSRSNDDEAQPSRSVVELALAVGVFAPVLLSALAAAAVGAQAFDERLLMFFLFLLFGIPTASAHALLLGLPAYLLLRRLRMLSAPMAWVGGFLTGFLPMAVAGIIEIALVFGILGMIGGAAFWRTLNHE